MKKTSLLFVILILLSAVFALSAVSCQSGGGGAETQTAPTADPATEPETEPVTEPETEPIFTPVTEPEPPDPEAAKGLSGWFDYGTALYLRDDFTPGTMTDGISIQMAQNEKEGVQFILTSEEDVPGLTCEVGPLSDGWGHSLAGTVCVARYLYVSEADSAHQTGFTPCMLLPQDDPLQGGGFGTEAGKAVTLYVRFATDKDTVPGTYEGFLQIKRNGKTALLGRITVRVRNVYYDEKTECQTAIGLSYDPNDSNAAVRPGPDSAPELGGGSELQRIYAQFLLDNRISPSDLPFPDGLLSEGAVEYMKNPRVTTVRMLGNTDPKTQYEPAKENGLLDKIYFSFYDEPTDNNTVGYLLKGSTRLNENYPGCRTMDAILYDVPEKGRNLVERLSDVTTMYCPKLSFFSGAIRDSMLKLKAERGDTLFWYVCGVGSWNTVNLLPSTPGADKRVLFWQQYQQNIDGFLYWRATYWNNHEDVWSEKYMTGRHRNLTPGWGTDDGLLVYWHPETGLPVSTLGLEAVRDGIEDFQLMKMAEAKAGRDAVLAIVEQITTSPKEYVRYEDGSAPLIDQLKNQLFDMVEGK